MAGEIRQKDKGAVNVQISLKVLVSVVSKTPIARRDLEEDLDHIGCTGLLNKPWSIKDKSLVRELVQGAPNQFDLTVRDKPERWTALAWQETYRFKPEGYRWASRSTSTLSGSSTNP